MLLILIFIFNVAWAVKADPDAEITVGEPLIPHNEQSIVPELQCAKPNATVALNKQRFMGDVMYPAGTEIYFDENGDALAFTSDKQELPIELGLKAKDFSCEEVTVIPEDPVTGELGEYSIPGDKQMAGSPKAKTRKGKVTHCYRAVKAKVRKRVTLTGESAYMAAPQLRKAGFKSTTVYKNAPMGSICVFGPGGKRTASGGHKHGHIGIKGQGGIINPQAGFNLKRPFIGCFYK